MIKTTDKMAEAVVKACGGNPLFSLGIVFLFYIWFNMLEAMIETLIWGERFEHWLDPLFIGSFIAFSGRVVWVCAKDNQP